MSASCSCPIQQLREFLGEDEIFDLVLAGRAAYRALWDAFDAEHPKDTAAPFRPIAWRGRPIVECPDLPSQEIRSAVTRTGWMEVPDEVTIALWEGVEFPDE